MAGKDTSVKECSQCRWNFDRGGAKRFSGMTFVPSFDEEELRYHGELVHGKLCCPVCEFRYDDRMQRGKHLKTFHGLTSKDGQRLVPVRHLV